MSKEELYKKSCYELYPREYAKLIESQIRRTFLEKVPSQCEINLSIRGKSDFFEWRFSPEISSDGGKVEAVLVNARNITIRKEEEGKLMETIYKKNKLYSILSHDLRAPFNSQLGFLDLLKNKYDSFSDSQRRHYISIIEESSRNTYMLLDSLLQWTKEYENIESIRPVYFDLGSLMKKAVSLNNAAILDQQLSVRISVSSDIIVHADYNMIFTVVRNILSNAIKFSHRNGEIYISALEKKESIMCKIQDFGMGITEDAIEVILNKNDRFSLPGTKGQSGYGLGLKFSKELIESNNGKIWIESEPGKGTSVFFTLGK